MDFVGIGFFEILLVLVIAMLVVGPRRLPELARKMGDMMRRFKMATTDLTRTITEEVERETGGIEDEVSSDGKSLKDEIKAAGDSIREDLKLDD